MRTYQATAMLAFAVILINGVVAVQDSDILKKLKAETDALVSDLTKLQTDSKQIFDNRVYNIKIQQMESVNGIVDQSMERIRVKVNQAKAKGKNVDHCLEDAKVALIPDVNNAFSVFDNCQKSASAQLEPAFNNLQSTLLTANALQMMVRQVALDCMGAGTMEDYKICIAQKVIPVQVNLKNLKAEYKIIQNAVATTSEASIGNAIACFQTVLPKIRVRTSHEEITANKCIKS